MLILIWRSCLCRFRAGRLGFVDFPSESLVLTYMFSPETKHKNTTSVLESFSFTLCCFLSIPAPLYLFLDSTNLAASPKKRIENPKNLIKNRTPKENPIQNANKFQKNSSPDLFFSLSIP